MLQHLGDRRLGNVQYLGGAADGANLHDGVEDFYVTQAHGVISFKWKWKRKITPTAQHIGKNSAWPAIKAP
ncbi:hypothetical protein GCM10008020_31620 [Massilia psychrophila]|nr:hypothetical protein GCM10008020_31620 [Massilia psychrophila]